MLLCIWRVWFLHENMLWACKRIYDAHCWQYWKRSDPRVTWLQVLRGMLLVRWRGRPLLLQTSGGVPAGKPHRIRSSDRIRLETVVRAEGRQQRTHFQNKGAVLPLQRGLLHLRLPLRADGGARIERGAGGQDHQAVRGNRQGGVHRRHQLLSHVSTRFRCENESSCDRSNIFDRYYVLRKKQQQLSYILVEISCLYIIFLNG